MSVLSAIFKLFKKLISKLVKFVVKLIKKIWPVLLIIGIAWFAPAIGGFMTQMGMPSWLVNGFTAASDTLIKGLDATIQWVGSGAGSVVSAGWSSFKSAELGTKIAVVTGASALLAPEETAELVTEVGEVAADAVTAIGSVVGDVASAVLSSPVGIAALGFGLYMLFGRRSKETTIVVPNPDPAGDAWAR